MDLRDTVILAYRAGAPAAALQAVAEAFPGGMARGAVWLTAGGRVREAWPDGATSSATLAAAALAAPAPAVVTLTPDFPEDASEYPGASALLLPLGGAGADAEAVVLIHSAPPGDPTAWRAVASALADVGESSTRFDALEEERDTFRRRAEEGEALHVMGLAANRTLDRDVVLKLVARFTRTLLGAHYVTVNTLHQGRIRTAAAAGPRGDIPEADPFAARVAAAGKPLTLKAPDGGAVEDPFHAAEGMRVGLGVPLALFGEPFGALVIGYRRPYDLTPRDTRLALTLAGHAAVALSNARLHGALEARSRELERANEELRWSAEAKDRFFASISHELRTPLNAILGFHDLLMDDLTGPLPGRSREFVERAHRNTQALLHLVNDVLDLSKIAAGKMDFSVTPMNAVDVVHEAVAAVEPLFRRRGLVLKTPAPDEAIPTVTTDTDRVRQIVVNLLSNAVKFTDRGEVTVTVHAAPSPDGGPVGLEVCVADTGPGISPDDQERIFHEFEQVSGTGVHGGTGLGLPISRKLARLLGGDLRVESSPGAGARFILSLPAVDDRDR
jgi:signal transduction histidine kinase